MSKIASISKERVNSIINKYDNNNGNLNLEGNISAINQNISEYVNKKIGEGILKNKLHHIYNSFKEGYIYINDSSHLAYNPVNCTNIDIRDIIKNGFRVSNGIASKPPKRLDSLMNILIESEISLSGAQSGGISCSSFNWLIAPFIKDQSRDELKNIFESYIFKLNQISNSRGGQAMFSSVGFDILCPYWLKDEPILGYNVDETITYKDLKDKADLIIELICEVMLEGDRNNSVLLFPNLVFNIDNCSKEDLKNHKQIFNLVSKFYLPYFSTSGSEFKYKTVMGCRTSMISNWTGGEEDWLRVGNAVYNCINLPLIALESDTFDIFKETIEKYMWELYDLSLFRYNRILEFQKKGLYSYHDQFVDFKNYSIAVGVLGLNEAIKKFTSHDLNHQKSLDLARNLLEFMENKVNEFKEKSSLRFALFSNPSESTCHKLAKKVVEKYGFRSSLAKGTRTTAYYTNGINLNVDNDLNIIDRIKIESELTQYCKAGNIITLNLGESYVDPTAILSLTDKINKLNLNLFWAYSGKYSICEDCGTKYNEISEICKNCESENINSFARVTGYMVKESRFNPGKKAEYRDRYYY